MEVNGRLELSRVVTNDMNKQVRSLTFINKYSSGGGPDPIDPPKSITTHNPNTSWPVGPIVIVTPDGDAEPMQDDEPIQVGGQTQGSYGPKTGDDLNITSIVALFALGSILTTGASAYLIIGGKSNKVRCLT
jgi:hypothetical protein